VKTKMISSTEAQNKFGGLVESATQGHTAYIVSRRNRPQVVIIGVEDLKMLLKDHSGREEMKGVLREVSPGYHLGEDVAPRIGLRELVGGRTDKMAQEDPGEGRS
jgi:prevent-host-death family protein